MDGYPHAGAMLRSFRKAARLSQKALSAKTQVADSKGIGIGESILSQIESGKRHLSQQYLSLIEAANVFSAQQLCQLRAQAITDLIRRHFGDVFPPSLCE